jgi:hypothetical protein
VAQWPSNRSCGATGRAEGPCAVRTHMAKGARDAACTSIDVVAKEEVVGLRREAAVLEEAEEVEVLTVQVACKQSEALGCQPAERHPSKVGTKANAGRRGSLRPQLPVLADRDADAQRRAGATTLTADLDGRLQLQEHWLRHEDLTRLRAQPSNLCLREVDLLAWPAAAHLEQLSDHLVDTRGRLSSSPDSSIRIGSPRGRASSGHRPA